jgi:hypothetical protein
MWPSHIDGEEAVWPGKRMGARELTGSVTGEDALGGANHRARVRGKGSVASATHERGAAEHMQCIGSRQSWEKGRAVSEGKREKKEMGWWRKIG